MASSKLREKLTLSNRTPREKIDRGAAATRIVNDPIVVEAFQRVRDRARAAYEGADLQNKDLVWIAAVYLQVVDEITAAFESQITTGEMELRVLDGELKRARRETARRDSRVSGVMESLRG